MVNNFLDAETHLDILLYYQTAFFSPVLEIWLKATKNSEFEYYSGLIEDLVCHHLPKRIRTKMDHLQKPP